jgi:phospholipase C
MRPDLSQIKNIVVVMMENRSFDHTLGYLSLNKFGRSNVEGLKDDPVWNATVASVHNGATFLPWYSDDPFHPIRGDPPHERGPIAIQLGNKIKGVHPMNGFVTNYASVCPINPGDQSPVMSYFTADEIPVTGFLADNFAICDRWFSSLPAGTQPNRLMAMSGYSEIAVNTFPLPTSQHLVYDWLDEHKISWRVYHEGMPFFAMMPRWIPVILMDDQFRRFDRLDHDLEEALPEELPKVLFMEPTYTDAPHVGPSSDDHAPTAVKAGQEFLLKVYKAFSSDPNIWAGIVMIITYDEHGGFFDHVPPVPLTTNPPVGVNYPAFETSGVRVPALIVSPFVTAKTVFHGVLDHTSILKFIGQVFGEGSYSREVDQRQVGSVWDVLNVQTPDQTLPPAPATLVDYLARAVEPVGFIPGNQPHNEIANAFKDALDKMQAHSVEKAVAKFPELVGNF